MAYSMDCGVMGMTGRPLKFKTPEELQQKVDEYFAWCETNKKPETIARLAYWLGVDRQTIYNYEKRDGFFDIIKRARERILAGLEEALYTEGKTGQIFLAKNYGYTDRHEIDANLSAGDLTPEQADALIRGYTNGQDA